MDSLDLKYAKSVLIELSTIDVAKKSDLFKIIKSHQVLDNLLESLQEDNYLTIKESMAGPKKYSISLTPKGRSVAEQLKRAEEAAKGRKFTFPDKFAVITFLDKRGSSTLGELKEEFHEAAEIVRELESLKVIRQEIDNSKHPPVNRILLTEKGEKVGEYLGKIEEVLKGD